MEINKQQLQAALGIVKPGLAKKEVIEQSTSFAFIDGCVVTYNDEISLSHPVEGLDIEGAVESDKLYQFLTKVKQEVITIEQTESEIIITAGRAKVGLTLQTEIRLPLDELLEEGIGKWKDLPESFSKFVSMCIPSCAGQAAQKKLTCVHVTKEGIIEASDGYRITHCELPEGETMPVETFLLPGQNASQALQLMPTKIKLGTAWVHFKNEEGTTISCRLFDGDTFPDTAPYLNVKGHQVTFPKSIKEILDRAVIFAKEMDNVERVGVKLENEKLIISAKTDLGWFRESVKAKYNGEVIRFKINPNLLKGIFAETQVARLDKDKLMFEGEGWKYMTVLQTMDEK